MSIPNEARFAMLLPPEAERPAVFVESGTFHGKTTRWARPRFREVHTVELSDVLHAAAVQSLTPLGVVCYHGDAAVVIPQLAAQIAESVVWFLDAHWTNCPHAAGAGTPLPLMAELSALAARQYRDTVIVDDVSSFGRDDYQPGWGAVTLESIAARFPGRVTRQVGDCVVVSCA